MTAPTISRRRGVAGKVRPRRRDLADAFRVSQLRRDLIERGWVLLSFTVGVGLVLYAADLAGWLP